MNETLCQDCQKFCQHYAIYERKIQRIFCGHCLTPKVRRKDPLQKACEHFTPKSKNSNEFVEKEYLHKRLLEYVLSLELLPDIQDNTDLKF